MPEAIIMATVSRCKHKYGFKPGTEETVCMFCKEPYVQKPSQKKGRPRAGAYVTAEKLDEIIQSESEKRDGKMWALLIKMMSQRGLRITEVIGKYEKGEWIKPGIRPVDIDSDKAKAKLWGCKHTIRFWRKRGKFKILPLTDSLYSELQALIKANKVGPEERIFPRHRITAYQHLSRYGKCVDTRYRIGNHAMRRSYGKEFRKMGGKMEDLQKIYSHEKMAQTFEYIGEDDDTAMSNLAKLDKGIET